MGLEIYTKAMVPRGGLLKRPISRDKLFRRISSTVRDFVNDEILAKVLHICTERHTLYVTTHPAASPIEFTWNPTGEMEATIKTSTAGPGFHAFTVDLLHYVGTECGLDWDWTDADETEYAITRDFADLQKRMLNILIALAKALPENTNGSHNAVMVNMSISYPRPEDKFFCVTPFGPLERDWWLELRDEKDGNKVLEKGKEFYSWWDIGFTNEFYRNIGLVLMWSEVNWHIAKNDFESMVNESTVASLERYGQLESKVIIPEKELAELKRIILLEQSTTSPVPQQEGIGYKRYPCRFRLPDKWSVVVQGYFYQDQEDDGIVTVFSYTGKTVRARVFSFNNEGEKGKTPDEILAISSRDEEIYVEQFEYEGTNVKGQAKISRELEEDGETYWILAGRMAVYNSVCVVHIYFDKKEDKAWAIDVFKTIEHPAETN